MIARHSGESCPSGVGAGRQLSGWQWDKNTAVSCVGCIPILGMEPMSCRACPPSPLITTTPQQSAIYSKVTYYTQPARWATGGKADPFALVGFFSLAFINGT